MRVKIGRLFREKEPRAIILWQEDYGFRCKVIEIQKTHNLPINSPVCFDPVHYGDILHAANDPTLTANTMRWLYETCWKDDIDRLAIEYDITHELDVAILYRIVFTGELNPPKPLTKDGRKKDWDPLVKWLEKNRNVRPKELSQMIGMKYSYLRKKLNEIIT